nr:uncharacterized protein I203_04906 [Kwoniella mangroviensis CBS 8507]OCF65886.1 hypothetical protein I203_04906 [Kwoniella mangroviensis CBS 8507]
MSYQSTLPKRFLLYLAGLDAIFYRVLAFPMDQDERTVKLAMIPLQAFGRTLWERAETDVITLKEVGDGSGYTVDMVIDGILMPIHVDTGSSQLWVAHKSCQTCVSAGMTYIDADLPEGCTAAGIISGCLVNTSVSLCEYALGDYAVLAATQVSEEIATNGELYSGTLGLADDKLTNSGGSTVISALYKQGQITSD